MDKYTELAIKLKALSEQGMGGEKYNAKKMLDKLIAKHGISPESIESEAKHDYQYHIQKRQSQLFSQVVYSVLGKEFDGVMVSVRRPTYKYVKSTKAQELEIRLKFNFYWGSYQKQLAIFYEAFLQINGIFSQDPSLKLQIGELSEEEKERRRKIAAMTLGMEKEEFLKALSA